jgi:exodeoxyribonuclease VII small subunit
MADASPLATGPDADAQALTFEQARDELAAIVDQLQRGGASLQESLDLWERGERLAARCERFLAEARARVEQVVAQTQGPVTGAGPTRAG